MNEKVFNVHLRIENSILSTQENSKSCDKLEDFTSMNFIYTISL